MDEIKMRPVAHMESDFDEKFGIPRQSGLVSELQSRIVFEPEYRSAEAVRGMEGFSHLWLLWYFSRAARDTWSPTVRPPRLGGNVRMGVFATRSPFRPNSIGLSCVKLESVELHPRLGPVIHVSGADLLNGTPILDIKPYAPYADCRPEATGGFTDAVPRKLLELDFPPELMARLPEEKRAALAGVLKNDPRPSYQDDPERVYGFRFAGREIKFRVENGLCRVLDVK